MNSNGTLHPPSGFSSNPLNPLHSVRPTLICFHPGPGGKGPPNLYLNFKRCKPAMLTKRKSFAHQRNTCTMVRPRSARLRKSTLGLEVPLWCSFCSWTSHERGRFSTVPFFTAMCTSTTLASALRPWSNSQRGLSGSRLQGKRIQLHMVKFTEKSACANN